MVTIFKKGFTCLLLVSVILQTFSQAVICMDFYARRDYIARVLCENRDKPMMHCEGRCQLCKRLNNDRQQDRNVPVRKTTEPVLTLFHRNWQNMDLPAPAVSPNRFGLAQSDPRVIDRSLFFFHPPD